MVKMYGPAFDESGKLVNRNVPEADAEAYLAAGYVRGCLPEVVEANQPQQEDNQTLGAASVNPELKKFSKAQLLGKAREEGLDVSDEMTKAQIIAALEDLDEAR